MPLDISNTAKAYLLAWKYTFLYSPLVLWWRPLSHVKKKREFVLTSPWFQHLFKITLNFPNTVKRVLHQGSRQSCPCCNRLLECPLRSEASLGRLWLGRGLEWACKVMLSCIPHSDWQNAKPNAGYGQVTHSECLWYLQAVPVLCLWRGGGVKIVCPLVGS